MQSFTIEPEVSWFTNPTSNKRQPGVFIKKPTMAFYHADYSGGGRWRIEGTIENMIWTLKNDVSPFPHRLPFVKDQLTKILLSDFPKILVESCLENLTVCVVPRSKEENYYRDDQLFFRHIVSNVVSRVPGFSNV